MRALSATAQEARDLLRRRGPAGKAVATQRVRRRRLEALRGLGEESVQLHLAQEERVASRNLYCHRRAADTLNIAI